MVVQEACAAETGVRNDIYEGARAPLARPPLDFEAFIQERDRCRDGSYVSSFYPLREGYFCNTNRMWDRVSQELAKATAVHPKYRRNAIGAVLALRMAGSPREEEKPGRSGAAAIMMHALRKKRSFRAYIGTMPFSGRKTYRAVVNKRRLAEMVPRVAKRLSKKSKSASLTRLRDRVMRYFSDETEGRRLEFHSLQIACDLYSLALVRVRDASDCPLSTGSKRGMRHVRRWEDAAATVASLAVRVGRPAHTIQTSLCEYDKYVRWWNGEPIRRRR